MLLLRNLESIQKKEGSHSKLVKQSKPRNHVAASSVNRKKKLTAIERENLVRAWLYVACATLWM